MDGPSNERAAADRRVPCEVEARHRCGLGRQGQHGFQCHLVHAQWPHGRPADPIPGLLGQPGRQPLHSGFEQQRRRHGVNRLRRRPRRAMVPATKSSPFPIGTRPWAPASAGEHAWPGCGLYNRCMVPPPIPSHRPRSSGCMNRSKEFERQRIELLSVEERIRLALSLRERFAGILQNTRADDHDGAPARPT